MKIAAIDIYPFPIRMRAPFRIATMVTEEAPNVLIRLQTDAGLTGWGEASPLHSLTGETQAVCIAAAQELRPLLLNRNPLEIASLLREMERFLPHNATIRSAFDMALYDLAAQAAGLPLYRLLGGAARPMETDLTLSLGDPAQAGKQAQEIVARGFRILKVKLGTTYAADYARLEAIREAVGPDVRLRLDANQGWDFVTARRALTEFAAFDVEFCEQPLKASDLSGLRRLSRTTPIPIMADETVFTPADALRVVSEEAAPLLNIKLSKAGGIHNALQIAAIAEAGGLACMVGCMLESRLGLTAAAHFAAAAPIVRYYDLDTCHEQAEETITGGISFAGGQITLPETPGLGAAPSPETLRRLEKAA